MRSFTSSAALAGLCSTLAAAAPFMPYPASGSWGSTATSTGVMAAVATGVKAASGIMAPSGVVAASGVMAAAATGMASSSGASTSSSGQQAFAFPLQNAFPNPSADQVKAIQVTAQGTLPNGPPPANLSADGLTNLRLIAFNELSEVAFFTELLNNVTNKVQGYTFTDASTESFVIDTLTAIQAQEQLHLLNANGALKHFNAGPIEPCKYVFPVSTFNESIALAATFTDVVLGTLGDVQTVFANNKDNGAIRGIASVIGQEGEQEGYFRLLQGKISNALPFLTASARDFAFSALQGFTVPGSCPNENTINLKIFAPVTVVTPPTAKDSTVTFMVDTTSSTQGLTLPAGVDLYNDPSTWASKFSLVLINQQNVPIVETISNVKQSGKYVSFDAAFPFTANELNGLTIAALTTSAGPFATVDDVAIASIAGPGLIEV